MVAPGTSSQLTVTCWLPPITQTPVGETGGGRVDAAVRVTSLDFRPLAVALKVSLPVRAVDWTMTCANPLKTERRLALSSSWELGLPLPTPMMVPPLMEKLISFVAVGPMFPFASSTVSVTTDTSRPSAKIVGAAPRRVHRVNYILHHPDNVRSGLRALERFFVPQRPHEYRRMVPVATDLPAQLAHRLRVGSNPAVFIEHQHAQLITGREVTGASARSDPAKVPVNGSRCGRTAEGWPVKVEQGIGNGHPCSSG